MATLFDENSNMTALSALNGVTAGPSTAGTNAMNSNHLVNQLLSVKDSRWLQIEVCREYQRGQCSRNEQECKYAHPPAHVDVQNGRVTACYDSIKGRCTRENPKCKYLHPPQHLKDQLLQAGRNNLALKNLLCSQLTQPTALPTMMPGQIAHLVQQQPTQQPLVPTLPFIPSYLTLPAGYHTLISAAPNGGADPYQTPPAILQQLALLQAQSPTNQPQLMLGSPAATAGAQNPLLNQALGAQNLAAMQQASLQQAFLQQLQQQQQLAALYGNSLAGGGAPSPLANFHTVASSMPSSMPNNSITTPESVTSHNSRKRRLDSNLPNGSGHNNSSSLSAHDSTSLFAATGLLNSTHASGTGGGSGSAAGAAASSITPIASATTDSTAGLVALQNQLLLAAAANGNGPIPMKRSAMDKNGIAVTSAQTQGLHIYAQHAAQFNPYLMQQALPGYIPVSFAGQLPPRF